MMRIHEDSPLQLEWTPRIGREAAVTLERARRFSRYGYLFAVIFLAFELGSQLVGWPLGEAASWLLVIPMIGFLVTRGRLTVAATQQAGRHLGLTPHQAKYMPTRHTGNFDVWISKRDQPTFPVVNTFRRNENS